MQQFLNPGVCTQTVKGFCDKIDAAGGTTEFFEYKGEGHGFMNSGDDIKGALQSALCCTSAVCMVA